MQLHLWLYEQNLVSAATSEHQRVGTCVNNGNCSIFHSQVRWCLQPLLRILNQPQAFTNYWNTENKWREL